MSQIRIDFPTTMPAQDAQQRLNRLATRLARDHGLKAWWQANVLYIQGTYKIVTINVAVVIHPGLVFAVADDPGMFRDKAETFFMEKLSFYLNPNIPIEKLPG